MFYAYITEISHTKKCYVFSWQGVCTHLTPLVWLRHWICHIFHQKSVGTVPWSQLLTIICGDHLLQPGVPWTTLCLYNVCWWWLECWTINRVDVQQIDVLDQWCLRRVFSIQGHDYQKCWLLPHNWTAFTLLHGQVTGTWFMWMEMQRQTKYSLSLHWNSAEDRSPPGSRVSLMTWPPLTWRCW